MSPMSTAYADRAFVARSLNREPGDTAVELLLPWQGLPIGTQVVPIKAGYSNLRRRDERTVLVISEGREVTGPF